MAKQAFIVVGLGYGDEGKGTVTDYLTRKFQAHTIIRFNGGSQAAHHVVTNEGLTHCFAQFGSGSLVANVKTYLSSYMVVDPLSLIVENKALEEKGVTDALTRLSIDGNALVTTPFHKIINQIQEMSRGDNRHGSCGKGVGQTILDSHYLKDKALFIKDLADKQITYQKLKFLWQIKLDLAEQLVSQQKDNPELIKYLEKLKQPYYIEELTEAYTDFISKIKLVNERKLEEFFASNGTIILEGAQGVLLDFERGFWPHVTKSQTTFANADRLLKSAGYQADVKKIGLLRAYSSRHGAGPFVTEDSELTTKLPDYHNGNNPWQSVFRVGWFDLIAAKYACQVVENIDFLAITNLDRLCELPIAKICTSYQYIGKNIDLVEKFFDTYLDNNQVFVSSIKVPKETSQEYQRQLAELLKDCCPIYKEFKLAKMDKIKSILELPANIKAYLNFISENLGIPIKIISIGVTAEDKIS